MQQQLRLALLLGQELLLLESSLGFLDCAGLGKLGRLEGLLLLQAPFALLDAAADDCARVEDEPVSPGLVERHCVTESNSNALLSFRGLFDSEEEVGVGLDEPLGDFLRKLGYRRGGSD